MFRKEKSVEGWTLALIFDGVWMKENGWKRKKSRERGLWTGIYWWGYHHSNRNSLVYGPWGMDIVRDRHRPMIAMMDPSERGSSHLDDIRPSLAVIMITVPQMCVDPVSGWDEMLELTGSMCVCATHTCLFSTFSNGSYWMILFPWAFNVESSSFLLALRSALFHTIFQFWVCIIAICYQLVYLLE